jgi:hypothetical protein
MRTNLLLIAGSESMIHSWECRCVLQRWLGVPSDGDDACINVGLAYHLMVTMCPSVSVWCTIWRWWCVHRYQPGISSGGHDASIDVGPMYHPAVMTHWSTPVWQTIWRWLCNYHRRVSVPTDGDNGPIHASLTYHPTVMKRVSMPDRSTIQQWWWEHQRRTATQEKRWNTVKTSSEINITLCKLANLVFKQELARVKLRSKSDLLLQLQLWLDNYV